MKGWVWNKIGNYHLWDKIWVNDYVIWGVWRSVTFYSPFLLCVNIRQRGTVKNNITGLKASMPWMILFFDYTNTWEREVLTWKAGFEVKSGQEVVVIILGDEIWMTVWEVDFLIQFDFKFQHCPPLPPILYDRSLKWEK